jgi:hypothetical protein
LKNVLGEAYALGHCMPQLTVLDHGFKITVEGQSSVKPLSIQCIHLIRRRPDPLTESARASGS